MLRPCLSCGELTEGSRCESCAAAVARIAERGVSAKYSTERGYNGAWKRLSRKARQLQPFCLDCGTRENLTCDHLPIAWYRRAHGLSVRLQDIEVVCDSCNRKRGNARPGSKRYEEWRKAAKVH